MPESVAKHGRLHKAPPAAQLNLIFGDADAAGPGTRRLAEINKEQAGTACSRKRPA